MNKEICWIPFITLSLNPEALYSDELLVLCTNLTKKSLKYLCYLPIFLNIFSPIVSDWALVTSCDEICRSNKVKENIVLMVC